MDNAALRPRPGGDGLDGTTALVTGAASGIGRAIAGVLAACGANLILADRDEAGVVSVGRELGAEDGVVPVGADVSLPEHHDRLVATALERFGGLDIALNVAGVLGPSAPLHEYPVAAWDDVMGTNARGVFLGMRAQLRQMVTAGRGCIVNMASIAGSAGKTGVVAYSASKHAVVGMTKVAAGEHRGTEIRVNCVSPAAVATQMVGTEVRGACEPEDIADAVLWLCSRSARHVTGLDLTVDGGQTACLL